MKPLVIGTRGSRLALAQAALVTQMLRDACPGLDVQQKIIRTKGDEVQDRPLASLGQKGLFVSELEQALGSGEIDAAVHSLKDLPGVLAPEFVLVAAPVREDPRDCLVAPAFGSLGALPEGAVVGTGSPRRKAQILAMRPDLEVRDIRGNVDTRLRKIASGEYHAAVLAVAGLRRLGLDSVISQFFDAGDMTPAVGQGAIAVEARDGDDRAFDLLRRVDDPVTMAAVVAERAFAEALGATCTAPVGAYAEVLDGTEWLRMTAALCDPDGKRVLRRTVEGDLTRPRDLGIAAAVTMREAGGEELLAPYL